MRRLFVLNIRVFTVNFPALVRGGGGGGSSGEGDGSGVEVGSLQPVTLCPCSVSLFAPSAAPNAHRAFFGAGPPLLTDRNYAGYANML